MMRTTLIRGPQAAASRCGSSSSLTAGSAARPAAARRLRPEAKVGVQRFLAMAAEQTRRPDLIPTRHPRNARNGKGMGWRLEPFVFGSCFGSRAVMPIIVGITTSFHANYGATTWGAPSNCSHGQLPPELFRRLRRRPGVAVISRID